MAEEPESGSTLRAESSPQLAADNRAPKAGSAPHPKEPGWYPVRTNPNEQVYWDGADWTGRRLWSPGTGWAEVGPDVGPATTGSASANAPRLSANPYAPHPTASVTTSPSVPGVTLGLVLMLSAAIAMMVGSVTTWISSNASFSGGSVFGGVTFSTSSTASGVDQGISNVIGINGYITLSAAIVVLLFAGLMAVSDQTSVRLFGCLFALASVGLSTFAVVRLAQKLNAAHPGHGVSLGVGWGLVLVLGAAVVATLISFYELTRSR